MKRFLFIFSFLLFIPTVNAHNANIKGYNDKKSSYVSSCNKKNYGYHKKDGQNHWHEVRFKNGQWEIVDSEKTFKSDPCLASSKTKVTFIKCVDGDTAVFKYEGTDTKFRFLSVDTPESVHPTKEVEAYAKEASKNTCDLLTNASSIYVEYDPNSDKTDKYGRNLAWIWVDDILLQELMISEGFARVAYIYGNYKYTDMLCQLQNQAINNNKGIWQYGYEVGYCEKNSGYEEEINPNNIYTVTFKNGDKIDQITVAEGMKVKQIKAENKLGFKFVGWYHDRNLYDFNSKVTSNITLQAKYKLDYGYIALVAIILIIGVLNGAKGDKRGKNYKKSIKHN